MLQFLIFRDTPVIKFIVIVMKKYLLLTLAFTLSYFAYSQEVPADSVSADGSMSFHGQRISGEGAVPVAEVSSMVEAGEDLSNIKLSGTIEECCKAKGCWMSMKTAEGKNMRITFKDYAFFVPTTSAGNSAIIEGKAFVDTTSVEVLRHYAVDGGMSEEEAEKTITEPEVSIAFEATGVIVKSKE